MGVEWLYIMASEGQNGDNTQTKIVHGIIARKKILAIDPSIDQGTVENSSPACHLIHDHQGILGAMDAIKHVLAIDADQRYNTSWWIQKVTGGKSHDTWKGSKSDHSGRACDSLPMHGLHGRRVLVYLTGHQHTLIRTSWGDRSRWVVSCHKYIHLMRVQIECVDRCAEGKGQGRAGWPGGQT